jgi:hypothetical protein
MAQVCATKQGDLAGNQLARLLLWRLPWAALVVGLFLHDSTAETTIWTAALTQMGVACLANAARCGRLHSYFTGPLFLLGAAPSLLRGLGNVPLAWSRIGLTMLIGRMILAYLPEKLLG